MKSSVNYLNPWIEQDLEKELHCDDPDKLLRFFLKLASKCPDLYDSSTEMDTLMKKCREAVEPICEGGVDDEENKNKNIVATEIKSAQER